MSVGQIDDVDVIANAGAVRRVVISPENFDMLFLSQRDLEHVWNQMRFVAVILAEFFRCPGSIKIAERNKLETVNGIVPAENFLKGQFRFAIGIDWTLGRFFID